jgi:hypothetical protein
MSGWTPSAPISAPRGPASTTPIEITVTSVLDGKVIAKSTKRVFQDDARRQYGNEQRWGETN